MLAEGPRFSYVGACGPYITLRIIWARGPYNTYYVRGCAPYITGPNYWGKLTPKG